MGTSPPCTIDVECYVYILFVTPVTHMNLRIQYFLLFSAVPTTSVSDITVTRINETAVRVTWMALTLNEARGFPSYVVSVMSRCEQVSSQRIPSTSVVFGGLMSHTEYSITVQVLTAGGNKEGPHSAPGEMDTEQITPYLPHVHVRTCDIIYAQLASHTEGSFILALT